MVAYDWNEKLNLYTVFRDFVEFVRWLLETRTERHFYEIINKEKRRAFFDLDVENVPEETAEAIKDDVISSLVSYFQTKNIAFDIEKKMFFFALLTERRAQL